MSRLRTGGQRHAPVSAPDSAIYQCRQKIQVRWRGIGNISIMFRGCAEAPHIKHTEFSLCVCYIFFNYVAIVIVSSCYIIDYVHFLPCYFVTLHKAGLLLHQDLFCVLGFRACLKPLSLLPSYSEALASSSSVSVSTKYFLLRTTEWIMVNTEQVFYFILFSSL